MNFRTQLRHLFNWNRHYYYLSFVLTIFSGIWSAANTIDHPFINFTVIIVSLGACFIGFSNDNASWKYLQSLPISKREVYHLKLADSLICFIPLTFWLLVNRELAYQLIADEKVFNLISFLKFFLIYLVGVAFVALWSFYKLFEAVRAPYVKSDLRMYNLQLLRNGLLWFSAIVFGGVFFIWFMYFLSQQFPLILGFIGFVVKPFLNVWGFLFFLLILFGLEYRRVFGRWLDEKRSYTRLNWNSFRDFPLMGISLASLFLIPNLLFNVLFSTVPDYLGKSAMAEAVHKMDVKKVNKLIKEGHDVNRVSSKGYSPLMVAALSGNEMLYGYLQDKGATKGGVVPSGSKHAGLDLLGLALLGGNLSIVKDLVTKGNVNQRFDGKTPLHLVSASCNEKVIDLLLETGADPNALIKTGKQKGLSPLAIASGKGCLNGVISLIENGANPHYKDPSGKLAVDYVKTNRLELSYYLQKKSRAPAGK